MFVSQNRILFPCCFALVAAVAVSGCSGGTPTPFTPTPFTPPPSPLPPPSAPPPPAPPPERDGLFSPEAQNAALEASNAAGDAAGNAATSGSVVQSSNGADDNGVATTTDAVSLTDVSRDTGGAFEFTVGKTVGSGGGVEWEVTRADGQRVVTNEDDNFEGFELEERVGPAGSETGTVYVDFYTDIGRTTTELVVPEPDGDSVTLRDDEVMTLYGLPRDLTPGTRFRGTRDGKDGLFSCSGNCPTVLDLTLADFDLDTITWEGDWMFTPGETATETTRDTDWLAGGVWLYIPDEGSNTNVEIGAFWDGGDPFARTSAADFNKLIGDAVYRGEATGIYAATGEVGYFDANATLTASFGGASEAGTIAGGLSGVELYRPGGGEVNLSGDILLTGTDTNLDNYFDDGLFKGLVGSSELTDTEGDYTIDITGGNWGGSFFGNGENPTDLPTSVGGTFGATGTSTFTGQISDISLVGTFGAER